MKLYVAAEMEHEMSPSEGLYKTPELQSFLEGLSTEQQKSQDGAELS